MIVKLPYTGTYCCNLTTLICKAKNPYILKANAGKTSNFKYFLRGRVVGVEDGYLSGYYLVEIADNQLQDPTKQLYHTDCSGWTMDSLIVEYINELDAESGLDMVYTDGTLNGTGTEQSPLGLNVSVIDGRY